MINAQKTETAQCWGGKVQMNGLNGCKLINIMSYKVTSYIQLQPKSNKKANNRQITNTSGIQHVIAGSFHILSYSIFSLSALFCDSF